MGTVFIIILVIVGVVLFTKYRSGEKQKAKELQSQLATVKSAAEEDVTKFGEEVTDLDLVTTGVTLDEGGRQDYQRALDAYETSKSLLDKVSVPDDIRNVTEALEDGRYAAACVKARVNGQPLPTRRPPCFFNPQHGPSTQDVDWAPAGGQPRPVPVCAADAERVLVGAEPAIRKVPVGSGTERRAYYEAGPAYAPYNQGYFNSYAGSGLLPGVLMGAMLFNGFGGGWGGDGMGDNGFGDNGDGGGGDMGDGGSGDMGGGMDGGGDGGGGFFGGDGGGGGFFDGGGGDGGGFDFDF